jgi:hypothetical protein
MKRSKVKAISLILAALIFVEITPLDGLFKQVFAAGTLTQTVPVSYTLADPTYQKNTNGDTYYLPTSKAAGKVDIPSQPGMHISKVIETLHDGSTKDITGAALNQPSYNGELTLSGLITPVRSVGNDSAQGYYAWWRNPPGSSPKWQADLFCQDGSSRRVMYGSSETEDVSGYQMSKYPGITTDQITGCQNLKLGASRNKAYYTNYTDYVPAVAVADAHVTNKKVNTSVTPDISGPNGTKGKPDVDSIQITSISFSDASNSTDYNIYFNQDFNYVSRNAVDKPDGTRLMVYFMAFLVDIDASTYRYPASITVEYTTNPDAPNLGNIKLDEAGNCVQSGSSQTFHFSFTNSGATAITQSFNAKVSVDGVALQTFPYSGLAGGAKATGTFSYTFNSAKTITIAIDQMAGESSTSDNTAQFPITPQATCGPPPPGPEVITGDFHFDKTVMDYGQSNAFLPDNVSVSGGNGCQIAQFGWIVSQGSISYTSLGNQSFATAGSFDGPPYPKGMGGGTVTVSMKIVSSCGTIKVVGPKTFVINIPAGNSPPEFRAAWFAGGNSSGFPPINQVVVGSYVNLGIIHDPNEASPKTPYDPDGDGIIYTWDFTGSSDPWIKGLKDEFDWNHDEMYSMLKADVLGSHTIYVSAVDTRGATVPPRAVTLNVVPPNPVPMIKVPPKIVEGRTYTPDFDGSQSYSPGGYSIVQYLWGNKQSIYPTAGPQTVTLDVVDSNGLHALYPASATVTVLADQPPIAQLTNPGYGIRNVAMIFKDTSYSPDDDPISEHTIDMKYDSDNNATYETNIPITVDGNGNFSYTSTKVGKYKIHIHVREGLGYKKSDDKDFIVEVINQAPEADYTVSGSDFTPPNLIPTKYTITTLLNDPKWKTSTGKDYVYNAGEDALETGVSTITNSLYPDISNFGSISNSNAEIHRVRTGICGDTQTCASGNYSMLNPHLFSASTNHFDKAFINPETTDTGDSRYALVPREQLYLMSYNVDTDKAWYRHSSTASDGSMSVYDDYVYRISTLQSAANAGNRTFIDPEKTYKFTSSNSNNFQAPPDPPGWVYPPAKQYVSKRLTLTPEFTNVSLVEGHYNKDFEGNTYDYVWAYDSTIRKNITKLQKKSPTGSLLWVYSFVGMSPSLAPSIRGISSDNSKLFFWNPIDSMITVIKNSDGTLITTSPEKVDRRTIYFHDDKIAYMSKTLMNPVYKTPGGTWNYEYRMSFYDMNTGNTTLSEPVGFCRDCTTTSIPNYPLTLTKDGKIVVAGSWISAVFDTNINLYSVTQRVRISSYDFNGKTLSKLDNNEFVAINAGEIVFRGDGKFLLPQPGYVLIFNSDPLTSTNKNLNYGEFFNKEESLTNGEVAVKFKFNYENWSSTPTVGVAARMQDKNNMYRIEVSPGTAKLVKYVGGVRTVLDTKAYGISLKSYYEIKLKVNGKFLKGYIGGVPLLSATDSSFSTGYFGPYSEVPFTLMKDFSVIRYLGNETQIDNVAIVNSDVAVDLSYSDAENDPGIPSLSKWTYTHTKPNKFLDAGDGYSGVSSLNGKTVTSPSMTFDKVGEYRVDYQIPDDPGPAGYKYPVVNFKNYQLYSDLASHTITIHRRPISVFTVAVNTDNTVAWTDTSYDPDRWLSSTNYSTEATGKDYRNTRGIFNYRYSYTSPSGVTTFGKLTRPQETGTYTVRQAVADEYGAWSDWTEQTINITVIVPNTPPVATLTFPNGTQSNPSYVNSLTPTITWNQMDADAGTTFAAYQVVIKDASGNVVIDSGVQPQGTTSTTASWTLNQSLTLGALYQVYVQVSDGAAWSNWSNIGWMITNRPPTATMYVPGGTQAAPTIFSSLRPTMQWNQTDPDPGTVFKAFQIWITNEANNLTILDSGPIAQNTSATLSSWTVNQDLPAGQKLRVMVRVFDGNTWSNWSAQTWFFINRPPTANFDWNPKPAYEGDTIAITNNSTDPDGDVLTSSWSVRNPMGLITMGSSTNYTISNALLGNYSVTLTVTDRFGLSHSVSKTISVLDLSVTGFVEHTDRYDELRRAYNLNASGDPEYPRPADMFVAGEAFMLRANTTGTGTSNTKAVSVQVVRSPFDFSVFTTSNTKVNWTGKMVDDDFNEKLTDGDYTFTFYATWSNGHTESVDVVIRIKGDSTLLLNSARLETN